MKQRTLRARKASKKRLKLLAQMVSNQQKILDVGTTHIPNYFIKTLNNKPDNKVIGFDLFPPSQMSDISCYDDFVQGDLNNIDTFFDNHDFDAIILGEVIEHVENPYSVLGKCNKILKEDGLLIITTPNPIGFPQLFFEITSSRRFFYTKHHSYVFSPRWMIRILNTAGFEVLNYTGLFWKFGINCPVFLSQKVLYVSRKNSAFNNNKFIPG